MFPRKMGTINFLFKRRHKSVFKPLNINRETGYGNINCEKLNFLFGLQKYQGVEIEAGFSYTV